MAEAAAGKQRLDKWLWYARILKSRTLAQKLVESGQVRVDGNRTTNPAQRIAAGQVLTLTYADRVRVLKLLLPGTRRGPATEAATLYQDLSPPVEKRTPDRPLPQGQRAPGAGRPTKKQRRDIAAFKQAGTGPD